MSEDRPLSGRACLAWIVGLSLLCWAMLYFVVNAALGAESIPHQAQASYTHSQNTGYGVDDVEQEALHQAYLCGARKELQILAGDLKVPEWQECKAFDTLYGHSIDPAR